MYVYDWCPCPAGWGLWTAFGHLLLCTDGHCASFSQGVGRHAESSTLIPGLWSCAWAGLSKADCITPKTQKEPVKSPDSQSRQLRTLGGFRAQRSCNCAWSSGAVAIVLTPKLQICGLEG